MRRALLFFPLGLLSGALVGLIAGGVVLNLILGRDPNATGIFVLLAEFPGVAYLTVPPWIIAWQITAGSTVLFGLAAILLSFRQQLTEYGQAKFQTRGEMTRNGLLQPLGAGLVFGAALTTRTVIQFMVPAILVVAVAAQIVGPVPSRDGRVVAQVTVQAVNQVGDIYTDH